MFENAFFELIKDILCFAGYLNSPVVFPKALKAEEEEKLERERRMQEAMLSIKKKFGKNAVLKGMNLEEGATAKDRNEQIGGHKA